jgi:hypothetical protein
LAGRIVCVERTVLLPQKPLMCVASGTDPCELTGPVMLDELDSLTPVNSICSVRGEQSCHWKWYIYIYMYLYIVLLYIIYIIVQYYMY